MQKHTPLRILTAGTYLRKLTHTYTCSHCISYITILERLSCLSYVFGDSSLFCGCRGHIKLHVTANVTARVYSA